MKMAQVFLHWCLRNKSLEPLDMLIPHQGLSMGLWPTIHMTSPKQMAVSTHLSQVSLGQWAQWGGLSYRICTPASAQVNVMCTNLFQK